VTSQTAIAEPTATYVVLPTFVPSPRAYGDASTSQAID
jgi:hypothetical protein